MYLYNNDIISILENNEEIDLNLFNNVKQKLIKNNEIIKKPSEAAILIEKALNDEEDENIITEKDLRAKIK